MQPDATMRNREALGLSGNLEAWLKTSQDVQLLLSSGVNPDGTLKPATIKALLHFCGIEIATMAAEAGYSDAYFHQVINRRRRDNTVENVIAKRLGLEADRIWPQRRTA